MLALAHIPGNPHEDGSKDSEWHFGSKRCKKSDECKKCQGMYHACYRCLSAHLNVGRCTGYGASGRNPSKECRSYIANSLTDQLAVGFVAKASHPIRNDGRKQRLD